MGPTADMNMNSDITTDDPDLITMRSPPIFSCVVCNSKAREPYVKNPKKVILGRRSLYPEISHNIHYICRILYRKMLNRNHEYT
jgi:hypothetical protein